VSFVWVYSLEAHPEEHPFTSGFETKDLGWDHPYFETTTMEQRAQRARWIKTDLEPDAELPIIIDYVNSPLGPDSAIKGAYYGAGFYSGVVIDCDGTILQSQRWAWAGPGGEWWWLSLASADDLRSFLDGYLADPPACYEPPSVARSPGMSRAIQELSGEPQTPATILIVDDDAGSAYEGYFKIPLGHLKKHFEVWDVQTNGSPASSILASYEAVVWLTGDASTDTLTPADQASLGVYLDGGGNLLLSGQNIGQDIGNSAFYHDYLHATLIDDDVELTQLMGADILSGMEFWVWDLEGSDGAGNQTAPSQIGLLDDAVGVLRYRPAQPPFWGALRWGGDYKVAYFAFGLEGIGTRGAATHRFKIMRKVFAWFDAPVASPVDGSVIGWGSYEYGQALPPISVDGSDGTARAIAAGGYHSCAIRAETGNVVCWGLDNRGQTWPPTSVDGTDGTASAVSTGDYHSCGIQAETGNVICWGLDDHGQTLPPTSVDGTDGTARAIAAGGYHSCAIRAETGNVVCWGMDDDGRASPPASVDGTDGTARAVAAGGYHSCAIQAKTDNVICWGSDNVGQASPPTSVDGTDGTALAVAAGGYHSCAIQAETDNVICWGSDNVGQASPPTSVDGTDGSARAIAAGGYHSCAIQAESGNVVCWGARDYGQASLPASVDGTDGSARAIAAGGSHTLAIQAPEPSVVLLYTFALITLALLRRRAVQSNPSAA
jgi:hypothetical protein